MAARLWDNGSEEKATWCSRFFLQWGCLSIRSQLMSCQDLETFYLAICGIINRVDYSGEEDWNVKSSTLNPL